MKRKTMFSTVTFFFFASVILFSSLQMVRANVVTNFAFTDNINGWSASSGSASHSTDGYGASGSILVVTEYDFSYKNWGYAYCTMSSSFSTGHYYFRVYGKCNVSTGFSIRVELDNGTHTQNIWLTTPTASGDWQIITHELDSIDNPTDILISLGCNDNDVPVQAFYDDVYFDTSSPPAVSEGLLIVVIPLFVGMIMIHAVIRRKKD
ncbi:MAG: hypothetical protein ACXAEU_16600 [Candidatus Hodarchaeales archaeon]|jgi:hypothetical protein